MASSGAQRGVRAADDLERVRDPRPDRGGDLLDERELGRDRGEADDVGAELVELASSSLLKLPWRSTIRPTSCPSSSSARAMYEIAIEISNQSASGFFGGARQFETV